MKTRLFILLVITTFAALISLLVGGSGYGLNEFLAFVSGGAESQVAFVFTDVRIPRTIICLLVGGTLAFSGVLLQTLLQNPLAEPYTLGISGGASLGAIGAIVLAIEPLSLSVPFAAFVFSLAATGVILRIANRMGPGAQRTLILAGVMISLFSGSVVIVLLSLLKPTQIQSAISWMTGQVGTERDAWWPLVFAVLLCSLIWANINKLKIDRLLLGEEAAENLGTKVRPLRTQIIALSAAMTAVAVATSGLVGFVGLLAPHLSLVVTKNPRAKVHIVTSVLLGSLLLLAADILARFLGGDTELPAGGIVALFGAPALIVLMFRRGRLGTN